MSHPPESPEAHSPQESETLESPKTEGFVVKDVSSLLEDPYPIAEVNGYKDAPSTPWWKTSGKTLLGLGVFAGLSVAIVAASGMFRMMSMSGMEGHDMGGMDHGGMSHDEMMGVDGGYQLKAGQKVLVKEVSISTSNEKLCGKAQSHVSSP